jgi:putative ABC transport system ATP-binding protein
VLLEEEAAEVIRGIDASDPMRNSGLPPERGRLLQAEGLTARPGGGAPLWHDLGFALCPGDRLGLVGASGAGKTLLLRQLALLDPLPRGRILLQGRSPTAWTAPQYRARVTLLSQRAVTFTGSVEENLRQALTWAAHRARRFDRERIVAWLRFLGREASFLDLGAEHLSGGESQLLALLRALQLDPMILLLDEPTASLDAGTTFRVEELLGQWLAEGERACVLTSHDAAQIERFTTRRLELTP